MAGTPLRVLLFCTKYEQQAGNSHLTNELARALSAAGHSVQVVAIDWDTPTGTQTQSYKEPSGVSVLLLAPYGFLKLGRFVARLSKWCLSSIAAVRRIRQQLGGERFDVIIGFSPAAAMAAPLSWATGYFDAKSYVYVTDFFPYHHRSLGLVPPGPVFEIARWLETWLLRKFDVIGCMSPMNVAFLTRHYRLRREQRVNVLPLWGPTSSPLPASREKVRAAYGLPLDRHIVVFGGQLTDGRGIPEILEAAKLARSRHPNLYFLMIGRGRLEGLVSAYTTANPGDAKLLNVIPREEYLTLVAACDIGLVATVPNVNVPTFPSKTIDYLRAGLPIVASVERSTDYGKFVREQGIGTSVEAGDAQRLLDAIDAVLADPDALLQMKEAGRTTLREMFDVNRVAEKLLQQLA